MSAAAPARARLEVAGLSCERATQPLFSGLGFSVDAGEALLVLGANGSGKTSLLRILAGLSEASAGQITWRGAPRARWGPAERSEMLYLGHTVPLKDELTVLENLSQLLAQDGTPAPRAAALAALEKVGLLERFGLPARHLSLGQRRRLGLARVGLARRTLWLLDEPATGLDQAGVALLESALDEHLAKGGLSILTSHQPLHLPGPALSLTL